MNHTFLWPDPPELAIARDHPPERRHVLRERVESCSDNERRQRSNCADTQLIAPADCKRQPMTFDPAPCAENAVGSRVIRIRVHRIGADVLPRSRKTNIECLDGNYA